MSNPPVAPAIVNAVCDALAEFDVRHLDMPVTPAKLWQLVHANQPAFA